MDHPTVEQQIRSELYLAFELLGARRELLATIGSRGDTLDDGEVLALLKKWMLNRPMPTFNRRWRSMRERLRLVNGELSVQSEPGRGTTVLARAPHQQEHSSMGVAG